MKKLFIYLIFLASLIAFPYFAFSQSAPTPAPAAMVCAYSISPPTVASGNFVYLQCDSSGKVLTQ